MPRPIPPQAKAVSSPSDGPRAPGELPRDADVAVDGACAQRPAQASIVSYEAAQIKGKTLKVLLSAAGQKPRNGELLRFRSRIEAALTQYITDVANTRSVLKPHELMADLAKIKEAAEHLAEVLTTRKHAQDAMVRVQRPQMFQVGPMCIGPYAPPEFAARALEIAAAASAVAPLSHAEFPYVRGRRDRTARNQLIAALIVAWDDCFSERASFTGAPYMSPFVRFLDACLQRVGERRHSSEALAKSCSRIARPIERCGVGA